MARAGATASRRVRERPDRLMTPAEIAELCDVSVELVWRAIERDVWPRATRSAEELWLVPRADVLRSMGFGPAEQLFSLKHFAELVDLDYHTVFRAVKAGQIRTVGPTWLAHRRIPISEYWRFRG